MNSKLKSLLLAALPLAFAVTSCQEPAVDKKDGSGKAASVITVGNGTRLIITTDTHWTAGNTYILDGEVIIRGAKLTIDAGVIVKGKKDATPSDADPLNSSLVIDRDAQIEAIGTSANPVIFTSDQAAGSRNPGDWGGVVILGPDVTNKTNPQIEGFEDPLVYGGTGDTRPAGSGVLQYCRFEFSGTILEDGSETNGLTLAGVHRNTTIDHIQISRGNDDGLEIFGGSVNVKFVIVWQTRDDDFDTDFGHSGYVQYAVGRRLNAFVSTESNGIETDNDGTGSTATPETNTLFANLTLIGPAELDGDASLVDLSAPNVFNAGMLVRRNSATNLLNSIVTAWPTAVNFRDGSSANPSTAGNYVTTNTLKLEGISVGKPYSSGTTVLKIDNVTPAALVNAINSRYTTVGSNISVNTVAGTGPTSATAVGLTSASFSNTAPSFVLSAGHSNLTNAVTLPAAYITRGVVQESFRGAFDTDGAVTGGNWSFSAGWLNFDPANAAY
jgi:hypothetical protein